MILDIIAVAILVLAVFFGFKKGFVKAFLGTASFFIAIILVFFLLDPVVSMVSQSSLGETIHEQCAVIVGASSGEQTGAEETESTLPQPLMDALMGSGVSDAIEDAQTQMANTLSGWVIKVICFVGLFIIINLLLLILKPILNGIFKLPVLSMVNRVGGLVVGGVNGGILLLILSCVLLWLTTTEFAGPWCNSQLAASRFASVIYYNNPLFKLFS